MIRNDDHFECACGKQIDCFNEEIIRAHIRTCTRYSETSVIAKAFKNINMDFISTEDLKVFAIELNSWSEAVKNKIKSREGKLFITGI